MRHPARRATCLLAAVLLGAAAPPPAPVARVAPVVDDYFGTKISDPYRWMESEPEPEFGAYLHAENDHARAVLALIPGRDAIRRDIDHLTGLVPAVNDVTPVRGRVFFLRRDAGGQIARLYVRERDGTERLLLDPQHYDQGRAHAEIDQIAPSDDGHLVAVGISVGGSENSTLHVIETATGAARPDAIDRARFASVSWAPDGLSFFFARLPPNAATAAAAEQYAHLVVYRHRLGDDPAHDRAVLDSDHLPFPFPAPATFPAIALTPGSDAARAVLADGVSPETQLLLARTSDLLAGHPHWTLLARPADAVVATAVRGDRIDLLTHKDARRFRILETTLASPDIAHARTLVPEGSGVITAVVAASDALYWATRDGAVFHLHRLPDANANGVATTARTVALPFAGAIQPPGVYTGGLAADPLAPGAYVGLESWVRPRVWLRYDPHADRVADTHLLPPFHRDLSPYVTIETDARAADGTAIPLSIVMRRDAPHDGRRPTYLEGYGAYGISIDPAFNPAFLPWLDRGGIYAIAHVRGGGEGGQAWHDAGKIATKGNTITDFIACAEALVARRDTDPAHLAGEGTSAGGILIGGAITRRPDLFRAVLIRVGATNTLREERTAGGPANIPEFGTVTDRQQFPSMLAMDAYNHVRPGTAYPAVLLTGGASDPRVTVWIPAKMTAKLQADTTSGRPVLFRVEFDAGHGIGSTRQQTTDERADEFAFLLWQFGEKGFQPLPN